MALDVRYPVCDPETLIAAGLEAMKGWQAVGADGRTGICLEILQRLNKQSFEIAPHGRMRPGPPKAGLRARLDQNGSGGQR